MCTATIYNMFMNNWFTSVFYYYLYKHLVLHVFHSAKNTFFIDRKNSTCNELSSICSFENKS